MANRFGALKSLGITALVLGLGAGRALADDSGNSVTAMFVGARHFLGFHFEGSAELAPDQALPLDLTFEHVHSNIGYQDSVTNLYIVGVAHPLSENNNLHAQFNYWRDSVNNINYIGPTLEYDHLWLGDQSHLETLKLSVYCDFFFYSAEENGFTVAPGIPLTVTTKQIHPNFMLEMPLLHYFFVPFVTYGHYFYTTSPSVIMDSLFQQAISFTSIAGIFAMVGGFQQNSVSVGSTFSLEPSTRLRFEFGRAQSAIDGSWATTLYNLRLEHVFGEHWRGALSWSHISQWGLPVDFGVAAAGYSF